MSTKPFTKTQTKSENRIFYWAMKQCLNDKTIKDCFWQSMKMDISKCTLHVAHCIRRNIKGSWGEKERFYRKEEEKPWWITNKKQTGVFWRQRNKEEEERKKGLKNSENKIWSFSWKCCRHLTSEILTFKQVCFFYRNIKPFYNTT